MTLKNFKEFESVFSEFPEEYKKIEGESFIIHILDTWEEFVEILTRLVDNTEIIKSAPFYQKHYYELYTEDGAQFVVIEYKDGREPLITNTKHNHISALNDMPVSIKSLDIELLKALLKVYLDYEKTRA